jgi:hypothetical protein
VMIAISYKHSGIRIRNRLTVWLAMAANLFRVTFSTGTYKFKVVVSTALRGKCRFSLALVRHQ